MTPSSPSSGKPSLFVYLKLRRQDEESRGGYFAVKSYTHLKDDCENSTLHKIADREISLFRQTLKIVPSYIQPDGSLNSKSTEDETVNQADRWDSDETSKSNIS